MAILIGEKHIPEIGDVIEKITMSGIDNILEIIFKSGKSVYVHMDHDDVEELREKYPASE